MADDDRVELARLSIVLADDYPSLGGFLRRVARFLILEVSPEPVRVPGKCRGCGADLPLPGPGGGRPRSWCASPACQRASRGGGKTAGKRKVVPHASTGDHRGNQP
jgi:hypothetical protein